MRLCELLPLRPLQLHSLPILSCHHLLLLLLLHFLAGIPLPLNLIGDDFLGELGGLGGTPLRGGDLHGLASLYDEVRLPRCFRLVSL